MKYCIFAIDNTRKKYTTQIRKQLDTPAWEELAVAAVNGSSPDELDMARQAHPYEINFPGAKVGHLGIWYSVLSALDHAPIVTFEDDALLHPQFGREFYSRIDQVPNDFDFFSLFIPRDSDNIFYADEAAFTIGSGTIVKAYQHYGGVSMLYSKQGAEKIKALLARDGITGQYDNVLYAYAKAGELNGYTSTPRASDLVFISGTETSIVQETEFYNARVD